MVTVTRIPSPYPPVKPTFWERHFSWPSQFEEYKVYWEKGFPTYKPDPFRFGTGSRTLTALLAIAAIDGDHTRPEKPFDADFDDYRFLEHVLWNRDKSPAWITGFIKHCQIETNQSTVLHGIEVSMLTAAMLSNNVGMTMALLDAGADVNLRNKNGLKVLDMIHSRFLVPSKRAASVVTYDHCLIVNLLIGQGATETPHEEKPKVLSLEEIFGKSKTSGTEEIDADLDPRGKEAEEQKQREKDLGVLGVEEEGEISISLIRKNYYGLALKWHPQENKDPEVEAKFEEIHTAYKRLQSYDKGI